MWHATRKMPRPNHTAGAAEARLGMDHIPAVDGVRGIAILIVVIHNASWIAQQSDRFLLKLVTSIDASGWIGVQLFFVLSGFLITGILLAMRGAPAFFRTFYIRRTLRIFPLYYVFLAVTFLLVANLLPKPGWGTSALRNQWWFWTYTVNWAGPFGHNVTGLGHFWSLAVEEQFYLVWPLVVYALPARALRTLCAAVLALTPAVRLFLREFGLPASAAYSFTVARCDALAAGALLAILLREAHGRRWLGREMATVTRISLVLLVLLVGIEHGFHEDDLAVQVLGQSLCALLSASLIYYCACPPSAATRTVRAVVGAGWLRFLGKYSYAIYIFHVPIHTVAARYLSTAVNGGGTGDRLLRLALYVSSVAAASILLALASWHLFEKPLLGLKDRLAPRQSTALVS